MLKQCVAIVFLGLAELVAKPLFEMTPPMYANLATQSMVGQLPRKFKYEKMEILVTNARQEQNKVYLKGTTAQYKEIVQELKKHKTLPEELKKQCREFSQLSFVNQGVEYILQVEAKNEKPIVVIYDKEACLDDFNPQTKIFIAGRPLS